MSKKDKRKLFFLTQTLAAMNMPSGFRDIGFEGIKCKNCGEIVKGGVPYCDRKCYDEYKNKND